MATVVDLFCGAGGLSCGFLAAGFQPILAVDSSAVAVNTYAENIGAHVVRADITTDALLPHATVIVGGPPCQGFSSAGLRKQGDYRNDLVRCFAEIVARCRPLAFVFENVEGFLTAERGERVFDLLAPLIAVGYRIHLRKINAANYGVPQHRKRVIGLGGLGWDPSFPEPTHSAIGAPGARLAARHLPAAPTLEQCLRGLPDASDTAPGNPMGHFFRPLSGLDLERARALRPGQTMKDLPGHMWHHSFRRRAFRRVMDGTPSERRGGAPAGIKRLVGEQPCKAITSGAVSEFIHPWEDRPLTLRECARVQTFEDQFIFQGSQSEQSQLIGNAVPPVLAAAIARHLKSELTRPTPQNLGGKLLSFVPTLSDGMSPALRSVTENVLSAFLTRRAPEEQLALWA